MHKPKLLLLTGLIAGIIPLTATPIILNSINFFNRPSEFEHTWDKFLKLHQELNQKKQEKDKLKIKIKEISNAFDDLKLKISLEIEKLNEKIEKLTEKIEELKTINQQLENKIKNYQSVDAVQKVLDNHQFITSLTDVSITEFQKKLNKNVSTNELGINFNQISEIKTNNVMIYLYILKIDDEKGSLLLKAEIRKNDIQNNAIIFVNGFISKNDSENDLLRKKIIPYFQTFNNQKNAFDLKSQLHKTNTWNHWWKIIKHKLLVQSPELINLIEKLHWKIKNKAKELPKDSQIGFETSIEICLSLTHEFKSENIVKVYFKNFKSDDQILIEAVKEIKAFFNADDSKNPGAKIRDSSESNKLTAIEYKQKLKGLLDNNIPREIREDVNNKNIDHINNKYFELPTTWLWELTGFNISQYNMNVKIIYSFYNSEEKDLKKGRIKWSVYLNVGNFNEKDRSFLITTYGFKH